MSTASVERSVFWLMIVDASAAAGLSLDRRYDSKMNTKQSLVSLMMASFDCDDEDEGDDDDDEDGGVQLDETKVRKEFASVAINSLDFMHRWANPDGAVNIRHSNDGIDPFRLPLSDEFVMPETSTPQNTKQNNFVWGILFCSLKHFSYLCHVQPTRFG
jgi:hypothetical protein